MVAAEAHPSVEELTAFTLGTLDEETQASIEAHVVCCTSCQERAAIAPGDTLVELLRRVHARTGRGADTFVGAATPGQTPVPLTAIALTGALAPSLALSAADESNSLECPAAIPPELARLARYRVVRLLGTGGMGAVYEAEHRVMHRTVALKVIKRAYTASAAVLERFRREVRAAACLSHPNIVATIDAEDAEETHFLVMEYVAGTDLGRLVQKHGPLPVDRACDHVRQAALGLQHAFEQGMVHRDIKPHNLMLTPDGRVKILDFGLARFASEAASAAGLTDTGIVLGTVDYIAPEQADNAQQADTRSDIYSLGCTLYHLLAGQPPFPTGTSLQKVIAHVEKKPQPLTELCPDLPEGIMPVLERMMAKNPKHRYQTPAEVALALEPFTCASAVARAPKPRPRAEATDPGRTVVLKKTPARHRRRPRLQIATALLAFLVAGLLGVGVYRIATDKGELVIETDNDDVEVVVSKGGKVVKIIDKQTGKHVTLHSGEYELALKDNPEGLKILPEKIILKRGDTRLATITRAAEPARGGLIARWPADGNARDSVGRSHGTVKGGVKFAPGVAGQAFDFNGIDGRINVGNAPSLHLSSGDFSISAWVNFRTLRCPHVKTDNPGDMAIAYKMLPIGDWEGGEDGWALVKQNDNHFWFGFGAGPGNNGLGLNYPTMLRSTTAVTPGVWYHVVVVKTAEHFSLYVNGSMESSKPVPAFKDTNASDLLLGAAHHHEHMAGLIDEVKLYSHALSPTEIKAAWSALAPATKPVVEKVGEIGRFGWHTKGAWEVVFSPDGRYALSAGDGGTCLWEVATGREVRRFAGNDTGLAFSPNGRQILTVGQDSNVRLWDVQTGKVIRVLKGHTSFLNRVEFSPDGRRALSGSSDGTVRLWDLESGNELRRFPVGAVGVAFSSDGRRALSGGRWDSLVRLWDVETGAEVRQLRGHTGPVTDVVFLPGDRQALSCSHDRTLRLWDLDSGAEIRVFSGHTNFVQNLAITRDGRYAMSASADRTVRLWDLRTGKELHCFTGHTDDVLGVAISPDGKFGLSGSFDKTVRLWRLPDLPPAKKTP